MSKKVNMEEIISSSFGEASSEIRANFKKTVLIRQYETEVIELETTLKLDKDILSKIFPGANTLARRTCIF